MRIHAPEIIYKQDTAAVQSLIEHAGRKQHLWYSVPSEWSQCLTVERCDAFVLALLPEAMKAGEDIYVSGLMSERLFYSLTHYYMRILAAMIPSLHRVNIIPEGVTSDVLPRTTVGVATGFSGGVDSFCLLADHFYSPVPPGFKVTHLLFHNVGSHGKGARAFFKDRYKRLCPAAQKMGLPLIKVDSNLDELLSFDFQLTHTLRNITAAMVLQNRIGRYYYASTFRYEQCFLGRTYDMAYADPMAVHLLSTESIDCISAGCQYSRVEKTMRVADIPLTWEYLDVCVHPSGVGNCSTCWKCARTLLTLEVLGKLELYDRVFDLSKYQQIRHNYMGQVLYSNDPLLREIRQLAQKLGFRFPFLSHCYHVKNVMVNTIVKGLKKVARRCNLKSIYARMGRYRGSF